MLIFGKVRDILKIRNVLNSARVNSFVCRILRNTKLCKTGHCFVGHCNWFVPVTVSPWLLSQVTVFVSILTIFPLPKHSSRIFFRDITNDAKKRWNRWSICDRWDSVPQVRMDGPWKQWNGCITVKSRKVLLKPEIMQN